MELSNRYEEAAQSSGRTSELDAQILALNQKLAQHREQQTQRKQLQELDGLDDEFSTLKFLAQEFQVRANSIRFQKAA